MFQWAKVDNPLHTNYRTYIYKGLDVFTLKQIVDTSLGKRDGSGSWRKNGWANERAIIQILKLSIIHFKEVRIIDRVEILDKEITGNRPIYGVVFCDVEHAASIAIGLRGV
ncbi:MAG: hypothetical protein ACJAQ4_002610 [Cryomorphaceae bacterium]|jgi:hypothetical protein